MKEPTLYRIETWWEAPLSEWSQVPFWDGMNKSKADGAWMVLRSFNGGGKRYRLIKYTGWTNNRADGEVVDEFCAGHISLN
jgi:hypothetical protein